MTTRIVLVLAAIALGGSATAGEVTAHLEMAPLTAAEQRAFVKAHNDPRKAVRLDPVEWSDDLAKYATEWVESRKGDIEDQVKDNKLPNPGHRPRSGEYKQLYGENIVVWGGTPKATSKAPEQAVGHWLKEKPAFEKLNAVMPYTVGDEVGKEDEKGNPVVVGHYTQLVWRDTKKIGAARLIVDVLDAKKRPQTRWVIIVCNYDPPGNVEGKKPY